MRKHLLSFLLWVIVPIPCLAQLGGVMVCPMCASEPTALVTHAQQIMQYIKEAQTALQAINMATMMAREGQMLLQHPSTNILFDLNMLQGLLVQSQGLAGTMAQMDVEFRNTYGGYTGPDTATTWAMKYNNWAAMSLRSMNGSLNAANYQGGMLQSENQFMQQVQMMNQMPLGQDQSLQLSNSIATEQVAQMQSLRQLMIADMTSKAAYTAQQVNTQQYQQAAQAQGFTHTDWTSDGQVF
jgi:type IV secretion system protein TrbJ